MNGYAEMILPKGGGLGTKHDVLQSGNMRKGRKKRIRENNAEDPSHIIHYVRWIFRFEFYTKYLITRELTSKIKKLRIKWELRAVKYEEKIRKLHENRWLKKY